MQDSEVSVADFEAAEIESGLKQGDEPASPQEAKAVAEYLDTVPADGVLTEAEDLEVGTIEMPEGLEATMVVPADIDPTSTNVLLDTDSGEISSAIEWSPEAETPITAGPGMGTWQSWSDLNQQRLVLKLYVDQGNWNDYLGRAEFETARRTFLNDGSDLWDRTQVRRWGQAIPQTWEQGFNVGMRVQKLWMSNNPINEANVRGWSVDGEGGTFPTSNETICSGGASFTVGVGAGSFSIPVTNCAEFDVWRGAGDTDAGHYRISYDQGAYLGAGNRELGYMAGYEMEEGVSGTNTYYEFVTFRIGNQRGRTYKCKSDSQGSGGTEVQSCWWNDEDTSPEAVWAS